MYEVIINHKYEQKTDDLGVISVEVVPGKSTELEPKIKEMERSYHETTRRQNRRFVNTSLGLLLLGINGCSLYHTDLPKNLAKDKPEGYEIYDKKRHELNPNTPTFIENSKQRATEDAEADFKAVTQTIVERIENTNTNLYLHGDKFSSADNALVEAMKEKAVNFDAAFEDLKLQLQDIHHARLENIEEAAKARLVEYQTQKQEFADLQQEHPEFKAYEERLDLTHKSVSGVGFAGWGLALLTGLMGSLIGQARDLRFKRSINSLAKEEDVGVQFWKSRKEYTI